jgi:uncharacterized membrane protein YphA (DoxX/SURF4 family)
MGLTVLTCLFAAPLVAQAHVKWFTDFSFTDPPLTLGQAVTPTFLMLALLTFLVMGALVFLDKRLNSLPLYGRIVDWLTARRDQALVVLRVGMGVTLLLSWQADRLLAPDLPAPSALVGWLQFVVALLLVLPITTPLAGIGVLVLYAIAVVNFGGFYMLDYFAFVGVGIYLLVAQSPNARIRGLRLPALYFSLGFSLMWLGLEKVIYPQWGLYILQQNPQLTLGLDVNFFLLAAAFVELALGYLLIIGLLERPLSLVVTLVFFTTTLVFGRTEIIGHTILHAALIVFLLEGPGRTYPAPINIHQRLPLRIAFAAVNFLIVVGVLLVAYSGVAQSEYRRMTETAQVEQAEGTSP